MKLLYLSDPSAAHTIKWINGFSEMGIEARLFGLSRPEEIQYDPKVIIEFMNTPDKIKFQKDGSFLKTPYVRALPKLRKIIRDFQPDIIHAHYASSYGLLNALSGFHPNILSVWGSDVFEFPRKSVFHKKILQFNLEKADHLFSTSEYMKRELQKYTDKEITVLPFGIDTKYFEPYEVERFFDDETVVIGMIKSMEDNYGVKYLLEAFAEITRIYPDKKLKLLLIGGGTKLEEYKNFAVSLGIGDETHFTGYISYSDIPFYHNQLDIAVYPSLRESFGVAALESSACGKPVITTDIGELPNLILDNETGFIVQHKSSKAIIEKLQVLIENKDLRTRLGKAGRKYVMQNYNFKNNLSSMSIHYKNILGK